MAVVACGAARAARDHRSESMTTRVIFLYILISIAYEDAFGAALTARVFPADIGVAARIARAYTGSARTSLDARTIQPVVRAARTFTDGPRSARGSDVATKAGISRMRLAIEDTDPLNETAAADRDAAIGALVAPQSSTARIARVLAGARALVAALRAVAEHAVVVTSTARAAHARAGTALVTTIAENAIIAERPVVVRPAFGRVSCVADLATIDRMSDRWRIANPVDQAAGACRLANNRVAVTTHDPRQTDQEQHATQ